MLSTILLGFGTMVLIWAFLMRDQLRVKDGWDKETWQFIFWASAFVTAMAVLSVLTNGGE